jgi:hypothetical protein
MKRMWKAVLAVAMSFGAITTEFCCADVDPVKTAAMMERMHPGFLGGLVDGAAQ